MTLRIDMTELTLGELADSAELIGQALSEALGGVAQHRAIAAMVCVVQRREDPGYTLEQALALRMADIEFVQDTDPEKATAGNNGAGPALLPAPGG